MKRESESVSVWGLLHTGQMPILPCIQIKECLPAGYTHIPQRNESEPNDMDFSPRGSEPSFPDFPSCEEWYYARFAIGLRRTGVGQLLFFYNMNRIFRGVLSGLCAKSIFFFEIFRGNVVGSCSCFLCSTILFRHKVFLFLLVRLS